MTKYASGVRLFRGYIQHKLLPIRTQSWGKDRTLDRVAAE